MFVHLCDCYPAMCDGLGLLVVAPDVAAKTDGRNNALVLPRVGLVRIAIRSVLTSRSCVGVDLWRDGALRVGSANQSRRKRRRFWFISCPLARCPCCSHVLDFDGGGGLLFSVAGLLSGPYIATTQEYRAGRGCLVCGDGPRNLVRGISFGSSARFSTDML